MKQFFFLFLFHLSLYGQTERVLFIGNSMTFFNDMPDLFKNIALSKGKIIDVTSYTVGGTGFVNHINDPLAYHAIRAKVYDYVILQPGTSESVGISYPVNITANRGKAIKDSIRKYSPCSKIFLYEIPYGVRAQNDYVNYFDVQKIIKDSVTKMSNLMQVEMIPAGEAARAHYTSSHDLALHSSYNDVHPNLNGSYMVAATVFSTLYQETSFPSSYFGGLAQNTAEYYQQTSGNTVLYNPSQWLLNAYHTNANFSTSGNSQQVGFTNTSSNYDTVLWDFGDGITSTLTNPSHHYLLSGTYQITLTVFRNACSYVAKKTINTNQLNVSENLLTKLKIFPNPTQDFIYYKLGKDLEKIEIYDFSGKRLGAISQVKDKNGKIDLRGYSEAIYRIIFFYTDKSNEIKKIIKK